MNFENEGIHSLYPTMNSENERNSIDAFEFLRISNSLEFPNPPSKHTLNFYSFIIDFLYYKLSYLRYYSNININLSFNRDSNIDSPRG